MAGAGTLMEEVEPAAVIGVGKGRGHLRVS